MLHIMANSQNKNETPETVTPSVSAYSYILHIKQHIYVNKYTVQALLTPIVLHHEPDNAPYTQNVEL